MSSSTSSCASYLSISNVFQKAVCNMSSFILCDVYLVLCILYCGCFNLFCNVWVCVCVGFVMCGCFGSMCTCIYCVFVLFLLCIFILFMLLFNFVIYVFL
jgi:hypothetical protein